MLKLLYFLRNMKVLIDSITMKVTKINHNVAVQKYPTLNKINGYITYINIILSYLYKILSYLSIFIMLYRLAIIFNAIFIYDIVMAFHYKDIDKLIIFINESINNIYSSIITY